MEKFTEAEIREATKFGEFFVDLLNNRRRTVINYLAETALFDWFGHTIKGAANIESYLKHDLRTERQSFNAALPVKSIGYRDTHIVRHQTRSRQTSQKTIEIPISTSGRQEDNEITPPQSIPPPSETAAFAPARGHAHNGVHFIDTPQFSAGRKRKLDEEEDIPQEEAGQGDAATAVSQKALKYIRMEGHITFHQKSDKKIQAETKWNRQCKLEIAYCGDTFEDCTIYMVIYQGTMKCRRNLMKDFEACETDIND